MRKITLLLTMLTLAALSYAQVTELWNFSVTRKNQQIIESVSYDNRGIAVSNDGASIYRLTSTANAIGVFDASNGSFIKHLTAPTGFTANYGGDIAIDGNGAIYASNIIISATGALNVAKWENESAPATMFITTTLHDGGNSPNRIGYGMDVLVDENGDGFLLMHKGGSADIKYWEIKNNSPVSQDPTTIVVTGSPTAITDQLSKISIVDKNTFWLDGNVLRPNYCTITRSDENYGTPVSITGTQLGYRTDMNAGVGGATEFTLNGKRYGVFAANNHGNNYTEGHYSILQEMDLGAKVTGAVISKLPADGLGKATDGAHFVKSVVHVGEDAAYIYVMGGVNGTAAFRADAVKLPTFTPVAGTHESTSLDVTIQSTTEDAVFYYTIDGSTPTVSSTPYTGAITLGEGTTIVKVLAVKDGLLSSIATAEYTVKAPAPSTKTFTVTVPQGTEKVYIVGSFPGKGWDEQDPYELTPTENKNEFTGTFACGDDIEYKYFNDKGNWAYQEASNLGDKEYNATDESPIKPTDGVNRTYNATDVVSNWVAVSKLVLTATVTNGPNSTDLYVKGGWDGWASSTAMTLSGTSFTVTLGGNVGDIFYSNTGYKYFTTNSGTPENWEKRDSNRWAIYPSMIDEIVGFDTKLPATGFNNISADVQILRTTTGVTVLFDGMANIELYNVNGALLDKTTVTSSYSRDLTNGTYILRINGQSIKFVK